MHTNPDRDGSKVTASSHLRLYRQATRLAGLGAWECDLATEQVVWTDVVYGIFGLPQGSRLTRAAILDLYDDESRRDMEAMRAQTIRTGRSCALDVRIRTPRGEARWVRLSIGADGGNQRPIRLFGAKQDVTLEIEARRRLQDMAERDALTGLANRAVFDARYREVAGAASNHGFVGVLALIDLDRFKPINDGFGHAAGDACLRQTGMRLQRVFEDAVLVARIGGDEFAVLLRGPFTPTSVRQLLERAAGALCRPVVWDGRCIEVGASIGATILGWPHLRKPLGPFAEADAALYAAKSVGRNTVRIFGDDPHPGGGQNVTAGRARERASAFR